MTQNDFPSIDNVPLSASDSNLIEMLNEPNHDPADRAALQASLTMLLKQRNMLAYRVSELLYTQTSVQSELFWKATNLQSQLDRANVAVELQYQASLVKDAQADSLVIASSK